MVSLEGQKENAATIWHHRAVGTENHGRSQPKCDVIGGYHIDRECEDVLLHSMLYVKVITIALP